MSSASELESHLIFAQDARIIPKTEAIAMIGQTILVRKMLYALINRVLSPKQPAGPPTAISR